MKRRLFAVLSVVLFGLLLVACGDKNYKVTFDVAGGTPAIASQTIKKDGLVTKPSDPTKDGYTFKLWEEKTSKKEWKFATDKVTKNITLVAQWEEVPPEVEKVTVTFEMKGGTPAVAAQTIDKGAKATKPADPTKDGFEFLGWYKGETAYDFTAAVNENLTLEAKWEELPP
ncbi:MAG: InlB B-repeat-containing protein, partial [Acholeplasmataceae bacterium]|nr:InlB B-repeat-containing protein [Acholeplasmataceae bacterium]